MPSTSGVDTDPRTPTAPAERMVELDTLRGFAVFGILVVNMAYFYNPFYPVPTHLEQGTDTIDRIVKWGLLFFAAGKFYTLFSFLFGLGMALQMTRAQASGVPFITRYMRRLCILFLIGAAHIAFFWAGDILTAYAVLGFPLLLFRNRSDRSILRWSVFFLILPVVISMALFGLIELAAKSPETAAQIEQDFASSAASYAAMYTQSLHVYASGTFVEIAAQRLEDIQYTSLRYLFNGNGPHIFASFLFGFLVGRWESFRMIAADIPRIRRLMGWSLAIGIVANLVYVVAETSSHPTRPSAMGILKSASFAIGAPAFSCFYVVTILLLLRQQRWREHLAPLSAVGRMALSNYLMQSLICTTLFYGYGLGLYGMIGPAAGLSLCVAIWMLQTGVSLWWGKRFRFGPVEWLWRSLTYLKVQPIRQKG
ncbi:MAG: DUF418 domain-containing protein [candidate division Zixibacteria bacterium]|nr:DUF418 domain-containing protein [candidate division Zixibacteria bacterium]